MYGGLFGDLPGQKGTSSSKDNNSNSETKEKTPIANATASLESSSFLSMPPAFVRRPKSSDAAKSQAGGILKAVGSAGTTMAFVPTAVKRKRAVVPLSPAAKAAKPSRFGPKVVQEPPATTALIPSNVPQANNPLIQGLDMTSTTTTTTNILPPANIPSPSLEASKQTVLEGLGFSTTTTIKTTTNSTSPPAPIDEPFEEFKSVNAQDFEDAPPAEILDPYDPYVPNDLLQYWDRQALAQERLEMEREAREALAKQQQIRQQLEKERLELQRKGDYSALAKHSQLNQTHVAAMGRGRGRGRGVSNLPAWLVEKQRQEAALGSANKQDTVG
jgi:hypothetical protein